MSRYRLYPSGEAEAALLRHCRDARTVWNAAVEQFGWWKRERGPSPSFVALAKQLTEARAALGWLRAGSQMVQQQALRDFAQATSDFFNGTHARPTWRKSGRNEGFRVVAVKPGDIERVSRRVGRVKVPKSGWVRFRWTRAVPHGVKSYRINRDGAGRWHVAFAAIPAAIAPPSNGESVGVDRGVVVSAALSTGELLRTPVATPAEVARSRRLQRGLARSEPESNRRLRLKRAIAKLRARDRDRRKDWAEKVSTRLARDFDVIVLERLNIKAMTASAKGTLAEPGRHVATKSRMNRGIRANAWGILARRLRQKAHGRVVEVNPAGTSQTCHVCGCPDPIARESQAWFRCRRCGYQGNADVNAAMNIRAAGRAVTAREGPRNTGPTHREPQLVTP